jgi:hypothetical protein
MSPRPTDPIGRKTGFLVIAIVIPVAAAVAEPWTQPAIGAALCAFVAVYMWRRYPLPQGSPLTVGQEFQRSGALIGRGVGIALPVWIACVMALPLLRNLSRDERIGVGVIGSIVFLMLLVPCGKRFGPRCLRCHTDFSVERKVAIAAGADKMKQTYELWQQCPSCGLPFNQPYRQTPR